MLTGNSRIKELIAAMIQKGREPHSLIITGEHGSGRKTAARYISAALLCERGDGVPCLKCRSCRMVQKGLHPDVIEQKPNDKGNYPVAEMRGIVSDAVVAPNEGRLKVYIIPDFDRSRVTGEQVQNILLKLIEEPPDHVVLILTADSKEAFLETILSRALTLGVMPCTREECAQYLSSLDRYSYTDIAEATDAVGGNIGRCIDYLEKRGIYYAIENARAMTRALIAKDEYSLLKVLTDSDSKPGLLRQSLEMLSQVIRDCAVISIGGDPAGCYAQGARDLSMRLGAARSSRLYDTLCEYIKRIDANCSKTLVINSLCAEAAAS